MLEMLNFSRKRRDTADESLTGLGDESLAGLGHESLVGLRDESSGELHDESSAGLRNESLSVIREPETISLSGFRVSLQPGGPSESCT